MKRILQLGCVVAILSSTLALHADSLAGRLWCDTDCDGKREAGEPLIRGVVALIDPDTGEVLEVVESDPRLQEEYNFLEVQRFGKNRFIIQIIKGDPTKTLETINCVDRLPFLRCGEKNLEEASILIECPQVGGDIKDIDFGYCVCKGSIGDFVWEDTNGNGCQDPGEKGLEGVLVQIAMGECGSEEAMIIRETRTNAQGFYLFDDLCTGDYQVFFRTRTFIEQGYRTSPTDASSDEKDSDCPADGGHVCVTLTDDKPNDLTIDCGLIPPPGKIGDRVWCDVDCDGIQDDDEPGVEGVVVKLRCVTETGASFTAETTTDAEGMYLFTNVPPGVCAVTLDPTSFPPDKDEQSPPCEDLYLIDLGPGESFLDADFCLKNKPSKIGDRVWCDLNCDGIQDDNEPGVPGVIVQLTCRTDEGVLRDLQTTDENGMYCFEVPAGAFCEVEIDLDSIPNDKEVTPPCLPEIEVPPLRPGERYLDADFCIKSRFGKIGDRVWCDLNCDGIQDEGEPGVPGVGVRLRCILDDGIILSRETTTDEDGIYCFDNLPPGRCIVTIDPTTFPDDKDNEPPCEDTVEVDLAAGEVFLDADFCLKNRKAAIGDRVWCDVDCDGIQDDDEPGVPGVRVVLSCVRPDGSTFGDEMVTDDNGEYLFEDLDAPSECSVEIDPTTFGDKEPLDPCTDQVEVDLDAGEVFLDADFCLKQPPPVCEIEVDARCLIPTPPPPSGNNCDGKVIRLTMRYTGDTCDAGNNPQEDKAECTDLADLPDTVFIRSNADDDPDKDDKIWFEGTVSVGEEYVIDSANDNEDKLDSNSYIHIFNSPGGALLQTLVFHTSCSKPLSVGDQFGANLVVSLTTTEGGTVTLPPPNGDDDESEQNCEIVRPLSGDVCDIDKPETLTWAFVGGGCAASNNAQKDHECSGSVDDTQPVLVTPDKGDSFTVNPGEEFTLSLDASKEITLLNTGGSEFNELHTSCSQPLRLGDQFGSLRIVGTDVPGASSLGADVTFVYEVTNTGTSDAENVEVNDSFGSVPGSPIAAIGPGESVTLERTVSITETTTSTVNVAAEPEPCEAEDSTTITVVDPPPDPNICRDGTKIATLLVEYTADGCSVTSHSQDAKKVSCNTFGNLPDTVFIRASKDSDPNKRDTIWFEGNVSLNSTFGIDAGNAGDDKLASNTYVFIFSSEGGTLLQSLMFHTSCSQPLNFGDQFGSIRVLGFVAALGLSTEGSDTVEDGGWQRPGDMTQNGFVDIGDAIGLMSWQFIGDPQRLPCGDGSSQSNVELLDSTGDGQVALDDAIWLLRYAFLGGAAPFAGTDCRPIVDCPDNFGNCEN